MRRFNVFYYLRRIYKLKCSKLKRFNRLIHTPIVIRLFFAVSEKIFFGFGVPETFVLFAKFVQGLIEFVRFS